MPSEASERPAPAGHDPDSANPDSANPDSAMAAVRRGLSRRCPACGTGRLFRAYLKVADDCPQCGEALHHHRADDFPAYIVIAIVGKIVVALVLAVEMRFEPAYWVHLALWPALTVGLTLALLQPIKGAVVAVQWFVGMDGFEPARRKRELAAAKSSFSKSSYSNPPVRAQS